MAAKNGNTALAHIITVVSCFPEYYYPQEELSTILQQLWSGRLKNLDRLKRFHENVNVEGRHLAMPIEEYVQTSGFGERNQAWIEATLNLGEKTMNQLLEQAQMRPEEIDLLAFNTITGIAVPSIDARLMNRIPFASRLKRLPLFGLGCAGGAGGLARVADYLTGHPGEAAALLTVELCSLTIQADDLSVANLIASGLFGDGAGAVLLTGPEHPLARAGQARVIDTRAIFFPDTERVMGWDVKDGGLKLVLGAEVPEVTETGLRPGVEAFLDEHDLSIAQIEHWIAHPGGPKVIQAVEDSLNLPPGALELSRESLARVGNISSASVIMVLGETLARRHPKPGEYGLLMAMGPAFSAELVLLQW